MKHITVMGGGFVGCEVALALAKRGRAKATIVSQVREQEETRTVSRHVLFGCVEGTRGRIIIGTPPGFPV